MNSYRIHDSLGAWLFERGRVWLVCVVIVLMFMVLFIQIGIHKGRSLEREAIAEETAALGASIASLEAEAEVLKTPGRHDGVCGVVARGRDDNADRN